jgi:tetratricopeptide (TPR) repeat protein
MWEDWIAACNVGIAAARRMGDTVLEASVLVHLGAALGHSARFEAAAEALESAADLHRGNGDVRSEATARVNLGMTYVKAERMDLAEEMFQLALVLHRSVENAYGEASVLDGLAHVASAAGDPETALRYRIEVLKAFQAAGDRRCEVGAMVNIGCALVRLGRDDEAVAMLEQGIEGSRELGFLEAEATGWEYLGEALAAQADRPGARDALRRSRALFTGVDDAAAARVAARLAELA